MKRNILSILFTIQKSKQNKQGKCPIICRLTYNKERKAFSTGMFIEPQLWDSKSQLAKFFGESDFINDNLTIILQSLRTSYLKLKVRMGDFTVTDIIQDYRGETIQKEKGLLEVYELHNQRIKRLVGKDIKEVTYSKYLETGTHLRNFVKWKFKTKDIQISDLKSNFVDEFEYYLKTEKNFQYSTLNKAIQRFRRVVKYAISEDYLQKDPFMLYKPTVIKKDVVFLTRIELKKLEEFDFASERLAQYRDQFIFCCYSGLGFKEMANLKKEYIAEGFDGKLWIEVHREKTNRVYKVPLLNKASIILDKFSNADEIYVFPKTYNPIFNRYLKEIASIVGIKKRLTHHIARKTFASTVLLYNDVPMEIVSKLLGHSKMQTTQEHYGHIIENKVSEVMKKLSDKL
ncbi:MAG TPA: site-specific integrase [Aequorivita sp.]|nr:site-specific integrase [Aequorivita sp.]